MPKKKKPSTSARNAATTPRSDGALPGLRALGTRSSRRPSRRSERREEAACASGSPMPRSRKPIAEVKLEDMPRFLTGSGELDRVLGGGIIPGSMVLIVGDPASASRA